jgi:hypothetical protein
MAKDAVTSDDAVQASVAVLSIKAGIGDRALVGDLVRSLPYMKEAAN